MVEYNKLRLEEYNGEIKLENNDLFFIDFMEYGQMPQQISARLLVDNNACFYVLVFFWKQSKFGAQFGIEFTNKWSVDR